MRRPEKPSTPVQFRPRPPITSPGHRPVGHVPGKPGGARKAGFRRGFRCHELRLTDAPSARLRDAARMAKLVNAGDLKSLIREDLSVRFRLRAPPPLKPPGVPVGAASAASFSSRLAAHQIGRAHVCTPVTNAPL